MSTLSTEMRLLLNRWQTANNDWPQRLEWLEVDGIRGWRGSRIPFDFPFVAIAGENGSGKSTILQASASLYAASHGRGLFASDFFPSTAWEQVTNASIRAAVRQGQQSFATNVRKPTTRWLGNPSRRTRNVVYTDLSRIQPVASRVGYQRLATSRNAEVNALALDQQVVNRLSNIMGRAYAGGRMSTTNLDATRRIPVVTLNNGSVSGFHQGAGELAMMEFLQHQLPDYSLLLIDEIETSLHPRAQRRLIRVLAELCRLKHLQIICTTHSPYVLGELPAEGRGYIMQSGGNKDYAAGVSPDFAMTMMDEEQHPEVDIYVEDDRGEHLLREILVRFAADSVQRVKFIRFGAASVGQSLGIMARDNRFPRPSLVFLDGDQPERAGCLLLPGAEAPERVVFAALSGINWGALHTRLAREFVDVADACGQAMTGPNHHDWIRSAANRLLVQSTTLWTAMCVEWVQALPNDQQVRSIVDAVELALPV